MKEQIKKIEDFVDKHEDIIVIKKLIQWNTSVALSAKISKDSTRFERLFLQIQKVIDKFNMEEE